MSAATKELELFGILSELNDDEREVVIGVALRSARRMAKGRIAYGPWVATTEERDLIAEAREEADDLPNYFEMDAVRRSRLSR